MHHQFLDADANLNGFLQKLDGRIKIPAVFLIILSVVFTDPHSCWLFAGYAAMILILFIMSRIPLSHISRRALTVIPFILLISAFIPFIKKGQVIGVYSLGILKLTFTDDGLLIFWNILIKSLLSTLTLFLLIGTTRHACLLRSMQQLGCPKVIVMILAFMYRYLFVLEDELEIMQQARLSRTVGGSRWFRARTLAYVLGNIFIRSYERGEAVYLAMLSRGFDGRIRLLENTKPGRWDYLFLFILTTLLLIMRYLEMIGHG